MNNTNAEQITKDCEDELNRITAIIDALGAFNNTVPFLTKYSIVKVCGTIEQCFKTIIADYNHSAHSQQIRNFIDATIRRSSMNPNFSNIHSTLKKFDTAWYQAFKDTIKNHPSKSKLESSLNSLNEERNKFAHGGQPSASFSNVKGYYNDAKEIILILDKIII